MGSMTLLGVGAAVAGGSGLAAPAVICSAPAQTLTANVATLTLSSGAPIGARVLLATSTTSSRALNSVTDSRGNTWTWITDGFKGSNLYAGWYTSVLTTALLAGDTITATYGATTTSADFIVLSQASTTGVDATGKGADGGTPTATTPLISTNSASPPTAKARTFWIVVDPNDYSTATVSDPNGRGWTLAAALDPSGFTRVYYQDVTAGTSSSLSLAHTGTAQWEMVWMAIDY